MKLLIKKMLRENLENSNVKIYTLNDIKNIVTQNDRVHISVHYLNFWKSPDVYNKGNFIYSMRDEYKPDKNAEYENELSFIKALWQRVHYFNKKGWYDETKIIEPKNNLREKEELEEGLLGKSFLAGLLMSVGLSWGQIKPEYKAKIDSIQKLDITPQQKRAEVMKIVQLNRNEIKGKKDEDFIRGAIVKGFADVIDEEAFGIGIEEEANNKNECKDVVYRAQPDGTKVRVNLKAFREYIKKHANDPDVGQEGLMDPSFSHTSCGISKAGAKQSKKDWSKK